MFNERELLLGILFIDGGKGKKKNFHNNFLIFVLLSFQVLKTIWKSLLSFLPPSIHSSSSSLLLCPFRIKLLPVFLFRKIFLFLYSKQNYFVCFFESFLGP